MRAWVALVLASAYALGLSGMLPALADALFRGCAAAVTPWYPCRGHGCGCDSAQECLEACCCAAAPPARHEPACPLCSEPAAPASFSVLSTLQCHGVELGFLIASLPATWPADRPAPDPPTSRRAGAIDPARAPRGPVLRPPVPPPRTLAA